MPRALGTFAHPTQKELARPYRAHYSYRVPEPPKVIRDPTPHPYGTPWGVARPNETPEARAYRRFPIQSHKPPT